MQRILFCALALMALTFAAQAAEAMVLSCFPERAKGAPGIDAYVDAFVPGGYPPNRIEAVRVLARFGEDVYEFFPEQTKIAELRNGELRIHQWQPLSAGESAEIRFEGKISAQKGEPFTLAMYIRNERRSGQGSLRCRIE